MTWVNDLVLALITSFPINSVNCLELMTKHLLHYFLSSYPHWNTGSSWLNTSFITSNFNSLHEIFGASNLVLHSLLRISGYPHELLAANNTILPFTSSYFQISWLITWYFELLSESIFLRANYLLSSFIISPFIKYPIFHDSQLLGISFAK